ncbi:MAG: sulfur oxidation c-type cytochrome SoxX [Rhodospirillales bacterium]|nr:sulfur oxidation c-type cytochrome SoxX [Rhodospirillales bacterium]MBO6788680.1 sulfur oxidation c-type cytochrome SoxX [Rhodospirillales bacterium]
MATADDHLVKYEVVDYGIAKSLTGKAGDPAAGEKAFVNRKQGNCLACHQVTKLSAHPFHGEIGPSLDGVAERYEEPQLRLQVVNAKAINPDTIMPAFYRTDGFHRVLKKFKDKTVLTAQQVEDIVAYLKTFK